MVEDLAYKDTSLFLKNKESALEFKLKGNNCFSKGDNSNALKFYTQVKSYNFLSIQRFYCLSNNTKVRLTDLHKASILLNLFTFDGVCLCIESNLLLMNRLYDLLQEM